MQNKKILMFANSDWYFALHWLDRALAAKNAGYDVHILAPQTDLKYSQVFNEQGFTYHTLVMHRTSLNPFGEVAVLKQCWRLVKSLQPDILHTVTIKPNLYMGLVARFLSVPIVSTYAGLGALSTSESLKYRLPFAFIKQCLKLVSSNPRYKALFENEEDLNTLVDSGTIPASKTLRVFGAGVDTSRFIYQEEDNSKLRLLFAARLLKDKGLSDLVEATRLIRQQGVDVELNVAGIFDEVSPTAYSQAEIESMARDGDFNWLGKRDDMVELIAQSNIVCLPTTYGEGVPRILIEGAACGRAIVATPLGGCKDICIDKVTGLQANPADPAHLAQVILELWKDKNFRYQCSQRGRKLVEDKFSNVSIVEENTALYKSL